MDTGHLPPHGQVDPRLHHKLVVFIGHIADWSRVIWVVVPHRTLLYLSLLYIHLELLQVQYLLNMV